MTSEGMRLRREEFGDAIQFYAPGLKRWQTSEWQPARPNAFLPVSVTGSACALQCDHCKNRVLDGMIDLTSQRFDLFAAAARLHASGTDGLLISGGSTRTGEVPLEPHLEAMRRIRDELDMKVVVHSGVVRPRLARGLADAGVDGVMLDIIGADDTIRDVYHLDLTASDFGHSLEVLAAEGLRIIPHIVIGLHYGRLVGEWNALEMIAKHPVSTLILVVLTPLVGTPMADLEPPSTDDVAGFFVDARRAMPTTRINLGCGRPMGDIKVALDRAAVDHGLNGIAYPADGTVAYAEAQGLIAEYHEYCCSLTWSQA